MKKLFVSLLLIMLSSSMSAGIVLKSGNAQIFSQRANVQVLFDYDKANVLGKGLSLEDFIDEKGYKYEQNWEMAQSMSHKDFIKRFNKKNPSFKLEADSTGSTKYRMIIQVRTIDMGNTAKSLLPVGRKTDGGVMLQGRLYIRDMQGNELCQLRFNDIKGMGAASIQTRLLEAYMALNNSLSKYIKKNVSQAKNEEEDFEESEDDEDSEDIEEEEEEEEE